MFRRSLQRQSRAVIDSISKPTFTAQRALSSHASTSTSLRPSSSIYAQRLGQRRWQSTEAEKKDTPAASAEGDSKPAETSPEDALKEEMEKKNKEIVDLKDKYLRSVADYRNLQERTKRDMDAARQFAIQRFAADLLDSIDNLDRAMSSVPKAAVGEAPAAEGTPPDAKPNADLVNLYSGLKMTSDIMLQVLKKHGLERFDPLEREGKKFNPQTDEATFFTKVEGQNDGEVFFTQSKGFTLNGRVIRAAKVGVVKNS